VGVACNSTVTRGNVASVSDSPREPISGMPDETIFEYLAEQWIKQYGVLSSTTEIVMSPAYQSIMAMGPKAVPFILKKLEEEGDQPRNWFHALRHITRVNPVPPEARGSRRAMAKIWLEWGRRPR
jgi:hypothetical protein